MFNLLIQVDFVFAVNVRVFVRQSSTVDDFKEKVDILPNELVRTINKLVILLSVLPTLLITGSNLNLNKQK